MSKFFESEVVQGELMRMQELYLDINKMGLLLTAPQKKIQLDKMMELINLQQTMFMRLSLCNDEESKAFMQQIREAARMLGMNPADVNAQFYENLKSDIKGMMEKLDTP
jgi:hypothetical protein